MTTFAVDAIDLGGVELLDGTGPRRRVEALWAAGWPTRSFAADLGYLDGRIPWMHRDPVTGEYPLVTRCEYDAICRVCWDLWPHRGPDESLQAHASTEGWVSVLAWDNIDDPQASPCTAANPAEPGYEVAVDATLLVDEQAVYLALLGDPPMAGNPPAPALRYTDRLRAVELLRQRGYTAEQITDTLRLSFRQTVERDLATLNGIAWVQVGDDLMRVRIQ